MALPGLLTGSELLLPNLDGIELAVLSACQSGRGIESYGHSSSCLRHAFQLAGVRTVVASHWSVDERATTKLLIQFMDQFTGQSERDAAKELGKSQRWMIDRLRRDAGHTDPYLWAAFSISGF